MNSPINLCYFVIFLVWGRDSDNLVHKRFSGEWEQLCQVGLKRERNRRQFSCHIIYLNFIRINSPISFCAFLIFLVRVLNFNILIHKYFSEEWEQIYHVCLKKTNRREFSCHIISLSFVSISSPVNFCHLLIFLVWVCDFDILIYKNFSEEGEDIDHVCHKKKKAEGNSAAT